MKPFQGSDVCARCATVGKCCCLLTPGQEELCFPVSERERQRIEAHGSERGSLVIAPNSAAFLKHVSRLFPADGLKLAVLFSPSGTHLRLATHPDGACTFLTADGCCLPREARPYYCRLFPFWVSPGSMGAVGAFEAKGCLAAKEGRSVSGMLAVLAVTTREVRDLHSRMLKAWGLTSQDDRNPSKNVSPKLDNNA